MDRIIKFRGKDKDTEEWVYGFYLGQDIYNMGSKNTKRDLLIKNAGVIVQNSKFDSGTVVDKKTLGQFTGLYDKNGKEIYEGDIILTQPLKNRPFSQKAKSKRLRGIVKYNIQCGKNFIDEPDKIKYWGAEWDIEIIDKKDYEKYNNCGWGLFFECEVIGNIYDNKNLLEQED